MKILSKKRIASFIGALIGGIAGYLYYYFIGCSTGSCAITSHPFNSIIYGAIMGYLLVSVFEKK
ncbi:MULTISPECIES: DUF6132 family protein [Chryseobacterium group]|uniref:DUF6132 family protein n=1 Tax=Chryseobacterium group TaxID=2782232 RepID=UPI0024B7FA73|nr:MULTISPECIES: DUF6132 family protein [Chryseobacterium group]